MYLWYQKSKLVSIFLALALTARAAVLVTAPSLNKRSLFHEEGDQAPLDEIYTFQDLREGRFQPITTVRPIRNERLFALSPHIYYFRGAPVIRFRSGQALRRQALQQLYANFQKFSVHEVDATDEVLTYKALQGDPSRPIKTKQGARNIRRFSNKAQFIKDNFGENVAFMAHGPKVTPAEGTSTRAPNWNEVRSADPSLAADGMEFLRGKLRRDRMLRFMHSNAVSSLGIRAHPDGRIEYKLLDPQSPFSTDTSRLRSILSRLRLS